MQLERIGDFVWELPRSGGMKVPGRVYLAPSQLEQVADGKALEQVRNVAYLPGIVGASLAMPDIHWGYGFPIGGVAAVDATDGAISPGGVGYDINCGCRLIATSLAAEDIRPRLRGAVERLYETVPTGVGASRAIEPLAPKELRRVLSEGAAWAIRRGFRAGDDDLLHCEEGGRLAGAEPEAVTPRALERGSDQLGTLGSGNHFLELQRVDEIYDAAAAAAFGLEAGALAVMIHSGSRGLGHETCDATLRSLARDYVRYGADYAALPDRQLGAMQAAANYAWANRQVMTGLAVRALSTALGVGRSELRARLVYDVCHNIAKFEEHLVDGAPRRVLVHRKGATRAFAAGDPRVPAAYRGVGQPVLIPGDMGRYSFVLAGNALAMQATFGSSCHGAGRLLSRKAALERAGKRRIDRELRERGIEVMSRGLRTLAEEMSEAYKDVRDVVDVIEGAGLSRKVARLVPLGVIKG
jgi:tRNA-splicing ligase RtcB